MKRRESGGSYNISVFMLRSVLILLVLGVFSSIQAQPVKKPQFDKWVFPNYCQLDFTGGAPVFSKTGAASVIESSGCYGDQNGNVLFYSDGVNMYDSTHSIMPNGVVWSSAGGRMGPLIVPVIGNSSRYYAFQVDGGSTTFTQPACGPLGRYDGLYYHIIDMNLNGGLGDIVPGRKNISLVDSTGEAVIGMMHENGKDFWIIVRKARTNDYYSYLVTENGVCTTPLISSFTGGIHVNAVGLMTLAPSHDATQIAIAQGSSSNPGLTQIFDFDNCTGRLSSPVNISNTNRSWYDVAFSPNDSLIYLTWLSGTGNATMFQFERFATNIPGSQVTLGGSIPWGLYPNLIGYVGMRVYGDTLYVANADSSLHILSTPNVKSSPGLINHWIYTAPYGSRVSYNFPNYFDYELDFKPKSYVAARDTFICPGDSLQIGRSTNCVDPEYMYSWSPSAGLDFDTAPNPWAQPSATTEYILTINFLCFTYTDTVTVYVPDFNASNDTTICVGDSIVLMASGGTSYAWSTGDTTALITVAPSLNTTFFVTISDSLCTTMDSIVVSLATGVIADISPLSYLGCAPDTIAFTNSSNGTDYFWDFGNGDTSNQVSPTYIYTSPGTYNGSLVAIDSSSCNIFDTAFFVVNILSPSVDAGPNVVICAGDSAVLTATGGITYLWSTGDTTTSITVAPSVDTTYYVTATDTVCPNSMDSVLVSLPAAVVADISPLTYSGCAMDPIAFSNTSNGIDYFWDFGNGFTSIGVSPTYTYTSAGIFNGSLVATDTSSCNISDTITFVITLTIVTVDAGPNTTICIGDSTVLTVSGGNMFLWSTGDTTASITVSPAVNTFYYATGTDGICGHKDSVLVSVTAAVVADISPLTYSGCVPDTIAFTNSSNGIDYFWDFGNGDISTQAAPTYTYTSAGTFNGSLVAIDTSSCNTMDTVTFVVNMSSVTADAGLNSTICNGDSIVLTGSGGSTYLWNTGDTTASITVSPTVSTTYFLTVSDSVCSASDSVTVAVDQPPPAMTISGANQICEGTSITLTAQGPTPLIWSTGDTLATITVSPISSTSYWVQSTNNCGTSSDTANIIVNPPPVILVSDDITINIGASVTLTASGANSYLWSTGATLDSIDVSPQQSTTYTVTGTDSLGCSAESSVTVSISIDAFIYVPNVFSIMSDNLENKRLFVFGQNINSLVFTIYDRWGKKVYESQDASNKLRDDGECCAYTEGWDGTFRNTGKILNGSVFVYILKGEFVGGEAFNESGNITLIQ